MYIICILFVYAFRSRLVCSFSINLQCNASFLFVSFIASWWLPGSFHSFLTSQVDTCLSEIRSLGAQSSPAKSKSIRSTVRSVPSSLRLSTYHFRGWAVNLGATVKLSQPGRAWQTLRKTCFNIIWIFLMVLIIASLSTCSWMHVTWFRIFPHHPWLQVLSCHPSCLRNRYRKLQLHTSLEGHHSILSPRQHFI